ncbi:hypothetical protein PAAG_12068 [Paracoccidioides lutzii Pb01]|uniref:Uncharacterized protein n=1 Tax=Paracoccidioides lutzii (strain ATCC MYA-826 / Pb01) TaxID=502779 RepID=A0A0A2V521_PARBA|nr:hypothetical protein PAAG_12068 [Paracoccidioides lutzii Pb01]KGQ01210.1 hypothetical protein PAAG_12068 [Paracoccidioides lutzii Pb01]
MHGFSGAVHLDRGARLERLAAIQKLEGFMIEECHPMLAESRRRQDKRTRIPLQRHPPEASMYGCLACFGEADLVTYLIIYALYITPVAPVVQNAEY